MSATKPSRNLKSFREPPPTRDRWLLSYADFLTLLLAVFMVLSASSWHDKSSVRQVSSAIHSGFEVLSAQVAPQEQPPPPRGATNPSGFEELDRQLQATLGDAIDKQEIIIQKTPNGMIISLHELGFFNSGQATLLPDADDKLKRTAHALMQRRLELRVEGHSDDQPIHTQAFQSNWELSTARAMSVLTLLLKAGFPPNNISLAGYGQYHPVASNASPEGRRMNRRVDLVIFTPSASSPETLLSNAR